MALDCYIRSEQKNCAEIKDGDGQRARKGKAPLQKADLRAKRKENIRS